MNEREYLVRIEAEAHELRRWADTTTTTDPVLLLNMTAKAASVMRDLSRAAIKAWDSHSASVDEGQGRGSRDALAHGKDAPEPSSTSKVRLPNLKSLDAAGVWKSWQQILRSDWAVYPEGGPDTDVLEFADAYVRRLVVLAEGSADDASGDYGLAESLANGEPLSSWVGRVVWKNQDRNLDPRLALLYLRSALRREHREGPTKSINVEDALRHADVVLAADKSSDASCPHGCDACAEEYMKAALLLDAGKALHDAIVSQFAHHTFSGETMKAFTEWSEAYIACQRRTDG